jgi:uncharacterized membrane protein YGL010W
MRITPNLLSWQWQTYAAAHRDRTNLALHVLLVPVFVAGLALAVVAPFTAGLPLAFGGLAAAAASILLQGMSHKREQSTYAPFLSPLDFVVRILVEQLLTFPGYVLSGGFARAWRAAGTWKLSRRSCV